MYARNTSSIANTDVLNKSGLSQEQRREPMDGIVWVGSQHLVPSRFVNVFCQSICQHEGSSLHETYNSGAIYLPLTPFVQNINPRRYQNRVLQRMEIPICIRNEISLPPSLMLPDQVENEISAQVDDGVEICSMFYPLWCGPGPYSVPNR